jgi:hypothetical protein
LLLLLLLVVVVVVVVVVVCVCVCVCVLSFFGFAGMRLFIAYVFVGVVNILVLESFF